MSLLSINDCKTNEVNNNNKISVDENNEIVISETTNSPLVRVLQKQRLFSLRTFVIICVWYLFSFIAIFMSKHILDLYRINLLLFSGIQLSISSSMAYLHAMFWHKKDDKIIPKEPGVFSRDFYFSMAFIGLMRMLVIFLGLLSMKYVALSFMETVKSSAPLFTLFISFLVLKEKSGFFVQVSIFPIMLGLVLCSAFEISFTWIGFLAAMGANVAECLQFVLSKIFLGVMDPSEFQLYSSVSGLLSIIPASLFLFDYESFEATNHQTLGIMLLVGICYYCQTLMAWILMEFLSPVTHSICNTVKCGVAVWLSVPIFGNVITLWSGSGSFLVIAGVIMYQKARSYEKRSLLSVSESTSSLSELEVCLPSNIDVIHNINN